MIAYLTEQAKEFTRDAGWLAKEAMQGHEPLSGFVSVTFQVYRPRKSGDLDGIFKLTLDTLNSIVYEDDKQVCELHAYRHESKENPRVEVEIEEVG